MSKNKRRNQGNQTANQSGPQTRGAASGTQPTPAPQAGLVQNRATLLWQAVTPLHVGTGQEGTGLVDLPVAREAATGYPVLPASSIKGSYRDGDYSDEANRRFGSVDKQGAMTFTDARLFALAVPSIKGTFALVTCNLVMHRLRRDALRLGFAPSHNLKALKVSEGQVIAGDTLVHGSKVRLGDYQLGRGEGVGNLTVWANYLFQGIRDAEAKKMMTDRLCVVPDDVFAFLCETHLDISPHVRLDPESKTVETGALWWEECIPAESLLTSFVLYDNADDLNGLTASGVHRIGGKETVGRGLVQVTAMEMAS